VERASELRVVPYFRTDDKGYTQRETRPEEAPAGYHTSGGWVPESVKGNRGAASEKLPAVYENQRFRQGRPSGCRTGLVPTPRCCDRIGRGTHGMCLIFPFLATFIGCCPTGRPPQPMLSGRWRGMRGQTLVALMTDFQPAIRIQTTGPAGKEREKGARQPQASPREQSKPSGLAVGRRVPLDQLNQREPGCQAAASGKGVWLPHQTRQRKLDRVPQRRRPPLGAVQWTTRPLSSYRSGDAARLLRARVSPLTGLPT
jgi:hypothetical protein